VKLIGFIGAMY